MRLQREMDEATQRAEAAEERIRVLEGKSQMAPTPTAGSSEGEEGNDLQGSQGNTPFAEELSSLDGM